MDFNIGVNKKLVPIKVELINSNILGLFDIWSRQRKTPKLFGHAKVIFGKPIEWKQLQAEDSKAKQKEAMGALEQAMKGLAKRA